MPHAPIDLVLRLPLLLKLHVENCLLASTTSPAVLNFYSYLPFRFCAAKVFDSRFKSSSNGFSVPDVLPAGRIFYLRGRYSEKWLTVVFVSVLLYTADPLFWVLCKFLGEFYVEFLLNV